MNDLSSGMNQPWINELGVFYILFYNITLYYAYLILHYNIIY